MTPHARPRANQWVASGSLVVGVGPSGANASILKRVTGGFEIGATNMFV